MSNPPRFPQVTIGALMMTDTVLTVKTGVPFKLGGNGIGPFDAINKSQLDAVQLAVDALAGSDISYDTLAELKKFIDIQTSLGVTNLTTAITNEAADRSAGDVAEAAARDVAIAVEAAARSAGDVALSNNVFISLPVKLNAITAGGESEPMAMPESVKIKAVYDGWHFKNKGPGVPTARKINWYLNSAPDITGIVKYDSVKELSLMVSLLSRGSMPFLTIYTKPKPEGGNAASWYHAKHTYIAYDRPELIGAPETQNKFLFRVALNGNHPVSNIPGFTTVDLVKEGFTSSGNMSNNDEILALSIGTDSSASAGNVNLVIHRFHTLSTNGNLCYTFSDNEPLSKLQKSKLDLILASMDQPTLNDQINSNE